MEQKEAIAFALVRDYLTQHGLHNTLASINQDAHGPSTMTRRRLAQKVRLPAGTSDNRGESLIEALVKMKLQDKASKGGVGIGRPKSAINGTQAHYRPHHGLSADLEKSSGQDLLLEEVEDDFDDDFADSAPTGSSMPERVAMMDAGQGTPIPLQEALEMRQLLFGDNEDGKLLGAFLEPWMQQGFCFRDSTVMESCDASLAAGLVQHQGGPCGILACVQAFLLKHLLFATGSSDSNSKGRLSANTTVVTDALAEAMTEILWQAGGSHQCKVAVKGKNEYGARHKQYRADGLTECLSVFTFSQRAGVKKFIMNNINMYKKPRGVGVVVFVYSILLSRGLAKIKRDMDMEGNTLIGSHGYCTQELVNLTLTGSACSNVFDGVKHMDELVLNGVQARSQIGFLTLYEHYEYVTAGEFYKQPWVPIWVVCSESHYTTLFAVDSTQRPTVSDDVGQFELHFYDELANQSEEFRLTIDYQRNQKVTAGDLESPLVYCIRTRWPGCTVDWNGSDPIL